MPDIKLTLLERAQVASPCSMRWEDMHGDDKVRRCEACSLNVHNLSNMTAAEAEALLALHYHPDGTRRGSDEGIEKGEGKRFCATFFRRADGTILTRDCPVGLAAVQLAAKRALQRIAGAAAGLLAAGLALAAALPGGERLGSAEPFASIRRLIRPDPPFPMRGIAGDMCIRPPNLTTPTPSTTPTSPN